MTQPYKIYGGLGSPYSMKMRGVMRYRRLPHHWIQMGNAHQDVFTHVKAPVIPVIQYPDGSWHNDSTPMVLDLEARHPGQRSLLPSDEADRFLAVLLEDMADEWGTKMMFHYRWFRERDQVQMSQWLAFDRLGPAGRDAILSAAAIFRDRQVGRMALVGCTEENAPLIEETANRVLGLLDDHVTRHGYLFGTRPSIADFSWYGQLSQLAVDPTPYDLLRARYPFALRWIQEIDDASGVEGDWRDPAAPLPEAITGLLALAGAVYFPFLEANAAAIAKGETTFAFEAMGLPYKQGTFKYQVKCLEALKRAYAELSADAKRTLDPKLDAAGCLKSLKG